MLVGINTAHHVDKKKSASQSSEVPCSHHSRIQASKALYVKNQRSMLVFHAPHTPSHSEKNIFLSSLHQRHVNVRLCSITNNKKMEKEIRWYLSSIYIPNSYYPIIITTSNMVFSVLIPAQATKFETCGHLHNRTLHLCWFINHLNSIHEYKN